MHAKRSIKADDFRVADEKTVLYVTLAALFIFLLVLIGVSFGLMLIIILTSVFWVKVRQGQFLGQCVKVSEHQFPEIHQSARIAAERLSMELPDVFIQQSPVLNAFAIGFLTEKSVVLYSALVEAMTEDELISIIGHELGHIKCEHTTWTVITGSAGGFQFPVLSQIMEMIFLWWSRKAEYTADRAGMLACRNLEAAITAEAKLAVGKHLFEKLNLDQLSGQKRDVEEDDIARLSEAMASHPYMVNRIHAFKAFYEGDLYKALTSEVAETQPAYCSQCGAEVPVQGKFCVKCGQPVKQ